MTLDQFSSQVTFEEFESKPIVQGKEVKRYPNFNLKVTVNNKTFKLWRDGTNWQDKDRMVSDFYEAILNFFKTGGVERRNMLVF